MITLLNSDCYIDFEHSIRTGGVQFTASACELCGGVLIFDSSIVLMLNDVSVGGTM